MLHGLEGISSKERLSTFGLLFPEHWKLRGELIESYRITKGIESFSQNKISNTEGHDHNEKGFF